MMNLSDTDAAAWRELEAAPTIPNSGFRYVNLCSVDRFGHPQARMVVLRRADIRTRSLEIHTDVRSPKWEEIAANPSVTILGFAPERRLQLRLFGSATLHGPGSEAADLAWDRLSQWTRSTYAGGPPGEKALSGSGSEKDLAGGAIDGKLRFGVMTVQTSKLDWFQLQRTANQRAVFDYDRSGVLTNAQRVNP